MGLLQGFKKGAASFYMVAFSTLILLVVVSSFAAIIVAQVTKTSNDDLAQSAYDSALAGVEDAKLAFYNYQKCRENGSTIANGLNSDNELTCGEIIYLVERDDSCDMVGKILGRIAPDGSNEVLIKEGKNKENNMQQAYTCVKLKTTTSDYRSTLSAANPLRVVKPKFANVRATDISKVKISWRDASQGTANHYLMKSSEIKFEQATAATPTPPMISVSMIQTGSTFDLDSFEKTVGSQTNRSTLFLVPSDDTSGSKNGTYNNAWDDDKANIIRSDALLKSNDKTATNLPYAVYCPENSSDEFSCSVTIELPEPIGETRNDETFVFVLSLPYGKPTTDFALEFFCNDDNLCATEKVSSTDENGNTTTENKRTNQVSLDMVQVEIDSTGRANNLYRRVQARLEGSSDYSLSLLGPLELIGGSDTSLEKNFSVKSEFHSDNEYDGWLEQRNF